MKVNQDKIDHLCALADAVERGETTDITDMSEEEFIAHLMDCAQPTLASLLEAFEAARKPWTALIVFGSYACPEVDDVVNWSDCLVYDEQGNKEDDDVADTRRPMVIAARRYIIARDFDEFRDGHWQTLYKLKYGGSL